MMRVTTVILIFRFSIFNMKFVDSLIHENFVKLLGSFAAVKHVRIPELLNQLCNESQGSNTLRRDACYGCFYRASVLPQSYPMLAIMSTCANDYLNNTSYSHCQTYLQNAISTANTRVNPTIIYCTFLECIRQVNKNRLDIDIRSGGFRTLLRKVTLRMRRKNSFVFIKVPTRQNVCIIKEPN